MIIIESFRLRKFLFFGYFISIRVLSDDVLVARQNTDAATFLHPRQILFRFAHVGVDLIHSLLDSVQLFCPHTPTNDLTSAF